MSETRADITTDNQRPGRTGGEGFFSDAGVAVSEPPNQSFSLGLIVVGLAVISGFATFLVLTGLTPIAPRGGVVWAVLLVNAGMIAAMIAMVGWQLHGLFRAWQHKEPGARLHVRIVALFSVIAAVPAILLAVAASTTFSRSLDSWFSSRTREVVQNTIEVAQTYLEEHSQLMRTEIVSMARDLDGAEPQLRRDTRQFRSLLLVQAGLRNLPAAWVINSRGDVLISGVTDPAFVFSSPPKAVIQRAAEGQVVPMDSLGTNRLAAVTRLESMPDTFLYVVRGISPKVVSFVRRAQAGVEEYEELRRRRGGLHAAHALMYSTISMTALLAAIWLGMWFASRFVAPISRLIRAAQQVSRGNLYVQLPIRKGEGDLRRLSQTFNTMTGEIKSQRDALVAANEQLSERRAFMEAVLSGVSAGVLGVDGQGIVTLTNLSAEKLLGRSATDITGRPLVQTVPELAALLKSQGDGVLNARRPDQVTLAVNDVERTFAVRVTRRSTVAGNDGAVVTFDDITELVSAQRASAWGDIARRIAHEIKNPLTPIQLSAERIRRKFEKVIVEDRDVFVKCTDTIIRQVGDVAKMVDEFSDFARAPKPVFEEFDLIEAVRDSVVLHQLGSVDVDIAFSAPDQKVMMQLDRRLMTQAITNLVKNGVEATQTVAEGPGKPDGYKRRVETNIRIDVGRAVIEVIDNGTGLGKQNRARLLEPYVTTKAKGTGLGLAIVQKNVELHGGVLTLEDAPPVPGRPRGALVRIVLPLPGRTQQPSKEAAPAAAE